MDKQNNVLEKVKKKRVYLKKKRIKKNVRQNQMKK